MILWTSRLLRQLPALFRKGAAAFTTVAILSIALCASCHARQALETTSLPPDIRVECVSGGLLPGHVNHSLIITVDGKGRYSRYRPDRPGDPSEAEINFDLSGVQLLTIWQSIQEAHFFELANRYANDDILDGAFAMITVRAHGRTHRVEIRNAAHDGFHAILQTINQVTPNGANLIYRPPLE